MRACVCHATRRLRYTMHPFVVTRGILFAGVLLLTRTHFLYVCSTSTACQAPKERSTAAAGAAAALLLLCVGLKIFFPNPFSLPYIHSSFSRPYTIRLSHAHLPLTCRVFFSLPQTAAEGSNLYGQENSVYPVLETYAEGGILEAKFVASTYHWVRWFDIFRYILTPYMLYILCIVIRNNRMLFFPWFPISTTAVSSSARSAINGP